MQGTWVICYTSYMLGKAIRFLTQPLKHEKPTGLYISRSRIPGAGYGVFCGKDLQAGEIIEVAPFIEIPREIVYSDPNILWKYVFTSHNSPARVILALGFGSMYNHSSDNPNVGHFINQQDRHRLLNFCALDDIPKGSELLLDYGPQHSVNRKT